MKRILAITAVAGLLLGAGITEAAGQQTARESSDKPLTLAVYGDWPYSAICSPKHLCS